MKKILLTLTLIAISALLITKTSISEEKKSMAQVMKSNLETLLKLQTFMASPEKFKDPVNEEVIASLIGNLSNLAAHVPAQMPSKGEKIEATGIASIFSDYLRGVDRSFREGYKDDAMNELHTATAFCMSCHTQISSRKSWRDLSGRIESLPLPTLAKARFYAATRQFDKAWGGFEKAIGEIDPSKDQGLVTLSEALRSIISIGVRVKEDPKALLETFAKIPHRKSLPVDIQRNLARWEEDLETWSKEPNWPSDHSMLLKIGRALLQRAGSKETVLAMRGGDISRHRAGIAVNKALALANNPKERSAALLLLGDVHAGLEDPLLWDVESSYFEACIRENPHSSTSRTCYDRLTATIRANYSGSGGINIPADEVERLKQLKETTK